jgi:hypothetical protein
MMALKAKLVQGNKLFLCFEKDGVKVAVRFSQMETESIRRVLYEKV